MKRNRIAFFVLSVATLLSVACSRQPINPGYSTADNTVLAKLVFNISTGNGNKTDKDQTKMTADAVQADGTFRGMDAVHIVPYKLLGKDHLYVGQGDDITSESFKAIGDINLSTLIGSSASTSASRIVEVKLPLGTDAITLYGKATKTEGADDAEGIVDLTYSPTTSMDNTPNTILFKLADRLTVDGEKKFDEFALLVGKMLEGFFRTGLAPETTDAGFKNNADYTYAFWYPIDATSEGWATRSNGSKAKVGPGEPVTNDGNTSAHDGYTFHTGTKYWREYGLQYSVNKGYISGTAVEMKPLEEVLGQAYAEFCTIKTAGSNKELRAASTSAILRTIADMALIIDKVANAIPTCYEEEIAKLLAEELQIRILRYYSAPNYTTGEYNWSELKFKKWNELKAAVNSNFPYTPTGDQTTSDALFPDIDDTFFDVENGFPINLHLPHGSSILTVGMDTKAGHTFDTFTLVKEIPAYGMGSTDYKMPIINYRFPPELMYFCNSPLRLSTKNDNVTFPATTAAWDEETNWPSATWSAIGASVTSTTRSAAIVKHVNYGNALLESQVKYADGIDGLHDNNSVLHTGEEDNIIPFTESGALQVTGILIGGQPDFVGWDFIAAPASSVNGKVVHGTAVASNLFDKLIYDKTTPFDVPASGISGTMYTLCWDNFDFSKVPLSTDTEEQAAEKKQSTVYVALELVNNTGKDFWGELNLVRRGGTFYLVGALDPNAAAGVSGIPENLSRDNYFYPPYKSDGTTYNIPRVFMQDYVTKAILVLGQYSLRHAYVTVPDLRGSQVSMGLSVDVTWEPGLNFNNVLMGGGE